MKIEINKELLGFQPYEFTSFLEGNSLISGYKYKDKFICDLMTYSEKGNYYHYEDNDVIFYNPTEINENGMFFFKIKNKFLIVENENFQFFSNFEVNQEDLNIIMIEAISKENTNVFHWCYSTMDYLVETTNKISKEKYYDYYPNDIAFKLNRFLFTKKINKSDIIDKLKVINTEEKIISWFYKE